MRDAYILGGQRIPFTKSMTHYMGLAPQVLMTATLKSLVQKYHLQGLEIGDVQLGAVMKSSADWGMARESVLGSGLSPLTPAADLQRACGEKSCSGCQSLR